MSDVFILIPFILTVIPAILFLRSGIVIWRDLDKTSANLIEKIIYAPIATGRIFGSVIFLILLSILIFKGITQIIFW